MSIGTLKGYAGKTVLITGHTGFKGTWLTEWLLNLGADVVGISIDTVSSPSHFEINRLQERIKHNLLDVRDYESLKKIIIIERPDYIFHLAAQSLVRESYENPLVTFQTNTLGTANLLESLRNQDNPCSVVIITSDKCYDNVEWHYGYREIDRLGGKDPYSGSKAAAELIINSYVNSFFKDSPIKIAVGRAGNIIGGGDWAADRIIPDCVRAWSSGIDVKIRNPNSTRPWQHVLEPLSGYLTLAMNNSDNSTLHGEPFNFGPTADQNYSVRELVDEMGEYWENITWSDASGENNSQSEAGLLKLNCDKARHLLNWCPTMNFSETVEFTANWYQQYYSDSSKNMYKVTVSQIEEYMKLAKNRNIAWAI